MEPFPFDLRCWFGIWPSIFSFLLGLLCIGFAVFSVPRARVGDSQLWVARGGLLTLPRMLSRHTSTTMHNITPSITHNPKQKSARRFCWKTNLANCLESIEKPFPREPMLLGDHLPGLLDRCLGLAIPNLYGGHSRISALAFVLVITL